MENVEVARTLEEMADLLEIQGANAFRVRAYRNAARTVDGLTRSLVDMVAAGEDLTELPAVGKNVAAHIVELLKTGTISRMAEVEAEIPRSLVVLTRLDGVGPKKARRLWNELGIRTVDELEAAAEDGRVEKLAGFGARSAKKILRSIQDYRKHAARFRIDDAERLITGLLEHMNEAPGLERLEVAGSMRRRRETVGDVDLLAQCDGDGAAVVRHFGAFPGADRVEEEGETKGNVILQSGLSVDLRVVPARSWGAALQYFTGSKEHTVTLRIEAVHDGIRMNEWGLFRVPEGADPEQMGKEEGERLAGDSEEGVYAALGLPWIEPVLRENRGEVEAAREHRLPELLSPEDILGDLHMHSTWSDGKNTIEDMARACVARGYRYMAITDHSAALAMVQGLTPEKARRQWDEIDRVREVVKDIEIFRGCEVDILRDGTLDMPDEILEGLDVVVASVHSFFDQDEATMTKRVLRAIRDPRVDILGHPTGRIINKREPFRMDLEAVLEAAAELDVAVELNANPRRLDLNDMHVRRAKDLGVRVVIDTDAHRPEGLDDMRFGVDQARRGWLEAADVLNTYPVERIRAWLARRGS